MWSNVFRRQLYWGLKREIASPCFKGQSVGLRSFFSPETRILLSCSMSDYTKKNIEHFDKRAASYDSPRKQAFAKKCKDTFLQTEGVEWNPNSTVVVDFACGTGCLPFDCANDRTDLARTGSTCT
jgi:hypothetical protein